MSLSIHGHTPCFTLKLCTRIALNFSCVLQSLQEKAKTIGAVKEARGVHWASSGNAARTLGLILHDLKLLDFLDTRFVGAKAIYSILIFSSMQINSTTLYFQLAFIILSQTFWRATDRYRSTKLSYDMTFRFPIYTCDFNS